VLFEDPRAIRIEENYISGKQFGMAVRLGSVARDLRRNMMKRTSSRVPTIRIIATTFHECGHYADFRIMPSSFAPTRGLMEHGLEMSA
jgi:hypothetical protein